MPDAVAQNPPAPAPAQKLNRIGLPVSDYQGSESTLCAGCGHDSITNTIVRAFWEMGVEPHRVAKMSGIGCSSKTPAYFISRSHGFNAVHGRMPAIATGTMAANRTLLSIGVSGDGDTASIGTGQFVHMVRRNVPCIYIVENNGVYGLTKGQFSATADIGSKSKWGKANEMDPIDLCALSIELGCGYVARSFSGDGKQLMALIKGAIAHKGLALLDVVSPCITFNNHEGSTKSYTWAKGNEDPLHEIGFVPYFEPITAEIAPGETKKIDLPDGSHILIKKLGHDYDPTNKAQALTTLLEAREKNLFLTGLIYINPNQPDFIAQNHMVDEPLATLPESRVRPPKAVLDEVMERLR
jgi:2-oxoglutarate ferredoxin oxidoreductase subunit beta